MQQHSHCTQYCVICLKKKTPKTAVLKSQDIKCRVALSLQWDIHNLKLSILLFWDVALCGVVFHMNMVPLSPSVVLWLCCMLSPLCRVLRLYTWKPHVSALYNIVILFYIIHFNLLLLLLLFTMFMQGIYNCIPDTHHFLGYVMLQLFCTMCGTCCDISHNDCFVLSQ
jgi:hypothetical protein